MTPNALDLNLALSPTGLAASAQDLTQSLQLGLDAPRVLTGAVQDRLVANGGALGEASANAKGVAGFSFGNANIWARGADQFGTATARATSAGVGYDINRAAPFIAGIDWRLDNGIVAGVGGDLRRDLGEVQGWLEHKCELVSGCGLCRLGRRAVVCARKRGRELQRFRDLAPAHALRPSGRRHLLALRPELSGPCRGWLPLGVAGRGRQCQRHAIRGLGLRERAYLRLFGDRRLRRAFGERGG